MDVAEISKQLEDTGYIVLAKPLVEKLLADLFTRCHDDDPARFHAAQVGRSSMKQQTGSIRGDVIDWLDAKNSTDCTYLACMEELRLGLNELLFPGLFDYENHYAIYGKSDGYAKHSDVLQGKKNRILTTVLYLNKDWQTCDGGELIIFEVTGSTVLAKVNPTFGTTIIFLSDSFPHEVLISNATRRSISGWFRVSSS